MAILGMKTINVETRFTPRIMFDIEKTGGVLDTTTRLLQPHLTATTTEGREIELYSPLGRPKSLFLPLATAVAALVGLGLVFLARGLAK